MRKGFTLIELLVVIAIIAILAAILFPVFAKAREKARQTTCLNNQRQIVAAITMYVQDHNGTLPEAQTMWAAIGIEQKVLICPTIGKRAPNGYVYNGYIAGNPIVDFDDPVTTGVTGDGITETKCGISNVSRNKADYDLRHFNKATVSYLDGHVSLVGKTGLPGSGWQDIEWAQMTNVSTVLPTPGVGSKLTCTTPSAWLGKAISTLSIPSDGKVEFKYKAVGDWQYIALSNRTALTGYSTGTFEEEFGLIVAPVSVFANFHNQGAPWTGATLNTTSVYSLSRTDDTVTFLQDGNVKGTFPTKSTKPLYVIAYFATAGYGFTNLRYYDAE